ncbi:uncharacterized protein LOC142226460 [Haematobia irritans]|uniref:uncharacterized protein LOC142226460 n=1 Tax=Haematobia irritans TaxID=7368 RepID=UPI003F50A415
MDYKIKFFKYVIFLIGISSISPSCIVNLPSDPQIRPILWKGIGNNYFAMKNPPSSFSLEARDTIKAFCANGFEKPYADTFQKEFDCDNYRGRYRMDDNRDTYIEIQCKSSKWGVFESSPSFTWCPRPLASYIARLGHKHLIHICYDIDAMTITSLRRTIAPNFTDEMVYSNGYEVSLEITNSLSDLPYWNITSSIFSNSQTNLWMQLSNYQHHSLIQDQIHRKATYDKLDELLSIPWWANLRLNNWRRYEEAFENYVISEGNRYDVFSGISGNVSYPNKKLSCNETIYMEQVIDDVGHKIPLYIWQYVKNLSKSNDTLLDVVVIGINSPFQEFYAENELIFCEDICSKVDWLQHLLNTFRYKTLGTIFCCSPDEVRESNYLKGFPEDTTDPPEVTEVTDITTIIEDLNSPMDYWLLPE